MITPNIPRLFTALAEWSACVLCILKYGRRFHRIKLWAILAAALAVQGTFLYITGPLPLAWWAPCMAVAVGLMFGLICLCCGSPWTTGAYCTLRAFLLAEFAASLEWQIYYFAAQHDPALQGTAGKLAYLLPIYGAFFLAVFWLDRRRREPMDAMTFRTRELLPPLIIGLAAFTMSNLSFVYSDTPFTSSVIGDIHTIRTLMDLAGLAVLYAYHYLRCELYARREVDALQSILENQYTQYRQSRESIDLINRKYHDLKHQIAVLRAEQDPARRSAFLDRMEEEIKLYEAQNKTGHPVLDTVLTGKSLYCSRHGIQFTCVADGTLLRFMDVMDLCSIFGNLLDNAIECELGIPDREKRMVHLEVYARKGLLVIACENYCEHTPVFRDGLPQSTKGDGAYHGYGTKSVRRTAEKYGGGVTMTFQDSWFQASVVIPLDGKQDTP